MHLLNSKKQQEKSLKDKLRSLNFNLKKPRVLRVDWTFL